MRRTYKRILAMVLSLALLLSALPGVAIEALAVGVQLSTNALSDLLQQATPQSESPIHEFEGKTLSILGDSISTFAGVSNNAAYNATLSKNIGFYSAGTHGVYQADTWWQQVIYTLGMELCVNNSSGGGRILSDEKLSVLSNGTFTSDPRNEAAYKNRCINLHNTQGEKPDVILVFLGTNDFSYHLDAANCEDCKLLATCEICKGTNTCETCVSNSKINPSFCAQDLGTANIDYAHLITQNQNGTFTYETPETTCEAYAIMLHKMKQAYPDAEIFCMGLLARRDPDLSGGYHDHGQPAAYNSEMKTVVEHFGATYIDLEKCGIQKESAVFDQYIGDRAVHPNAAGMDMISRAVIDAMMGREDASCNITWNLTGVAADTNVSMILDGASFTATLTADTGYKISSLSITMGGTDITASCCQNGKVSIPKVTGDIVITAQAQKKPQSYRWELQNGDLVSVDNTNTLMKSTISDGVQHKMETSVVLRHDLPWSLEWKGAGTGGFMLAKAGQSNDGNSYFFHRKDNSLDAFGCYRNNQSQNYGFSFSDVDTATHTYRLKNVITTEGNMVWMQVDDGQWVSLNNYYIAATNQNTTDNWISGRDFIFNYIGTDYHPLTDYTVEYLQIEECGHSYSGANCTACGAENPEAEDFAGKTLSILGDSISTYTGVSNNTSYNSTLGGGAIYYTAGKQGVYQADTWWQQTVDALGMELLVNNSWSGSAVLPTRSGTAGAYVDRCVQLHNDHTNEDPDVIAVFMGTNDFSYYQSTLGTADIDYDTLITDNGDGTFTYTTPTTTCEAYAIMLHKMTVRYPDAEIYCMTMLPRRAEDHDNKDVVPQPTAFNAELAKIINRFGCTVVDLEHCGISTANEEFDRYITDQRVHPGPAGMDKMTEALICAMLGREVKLYSVSGAYTGVKTDNTAAVTADGMGYTANLSLAEGYSNLKITVTMGGQDITSSCYSDGKITIPSVNGDIVISATAQRNPLSFRWEYENGELVSTGNTENTLTKLAGTTTDGVLTNTYYRLDKQVVLRCDLPWVLEWSASGTWSGMILSSNQTSSADGNTYIFKTGSNSGLIAFGQRVGSQYQNYGVPLTAQGVDTTAKHTYRLVNRPAADGTNMVYLWVDGVNYGAMNQYHIGADSQGQTIDWVSGKNLTFSYIGSNGHAINNCVLDYIQVWEGGCAHTYESAVTAPTCTEQGYTTHTCTGCGATYTTDHVDALGHSYSSMNCTACGTEHPAAADYAGKVISIMGDSISTFAGYIPVADGFNREHLARYPQDNLLTNVNETWWMQVISNLNAKLGINDSWRGATLSGAVPVTTGDTGENAAMSNLTRIQNLGSNGTPDVILLYGGTNDLAHVEKIGTFDPETAPTVVDLTTTKWDNLADGFLHTILRIRHYYPNAVIVAMLPTYTTSYYYNEKLAQGNAVMASICEHYGITYVDLRYCGITTDDLPDGIHPNATGMDYITDAVLESLLNACEMEPGEHIVHSVKHALIGAESSLGYYKGISDSQSFVTVITGEELTVTVTMGGVDITASVYADGVVTIPSVTGDIVITAEGRQKAIYEDYLQQLPDGICPNTNLWPLLTHDAEYYTVDGWGIHPSGTVYSVTMPINPGDQLWATSFQKAGDNGSTINGIRLTWFDESGVLKSLSATETYSEFSTNGYLTAPKGAVAVNVVMWTGDASNELHILNAAHTYESAVTAPTCTEQGYTTHTCTTCGDSYVDTYVDASHSYVCTVTLPNGIVPGYTDYVCAVCQDSYRTDWLDPSAYEGKTLACIGDSITAGVGVTAGQTDYVHLLAQQLGMDYIRLGASGTTLCTDGSRTCNISKLTEDNLMGADVVTILMGINDFCAAGAGYYALGDIESTDTSTIYGAVKMWCERIVELRQLESMKDTQFYFVTPVITSWNNSVSSARVWNQSKTNVHGYTLRDLCNAIVEVCAQYDVPVIDLNLISGLYYISEEDNTTEQFGGDGVHPGALGHEMMANALADALLQNEFRDDHTHTYGSWITTKYPGCMDGEEKRVCSVCTATESRVLTGAGHTYESTVTASTCTEQGYTSHTCTTCGDSYVDSYVDVVWHSYDDGQCAMCGCDMLRFTTDDIIQYQGGVNAEDGTLNTTFTNNWYTNIRIPKGAEQVRVLTFKTGASWGSAFFGEKGFLSGFCDPDVGGQWITVDIPEDATVFRYGYLYDQNAQNNGWQIFQYVEFVGQELEALEPAPYMERPATGCHSFAVDVNIAPAMGEADGYTIGTDYGYIMLPTNYSAYGEPTRLIIVCHGAGTNLGTYQSNAWKTNNYSFWTDLGYAVMDMYACPQELSGSDSCLHYGNPVVLDCYKAGYDYVMEHFNLKRDGIYVIGASMGGLSSFQIVQSGLFPVLAQVAYCPVIDLFKQAYCNPWTTASYQRSRIASYFGFVGTMPAFTDGKFPSAEEIAFYRQNFGRTVPYSPILRNVVSGDIRSIFDVIPGSATARDEAEAALYAQLTATHPCPLIIFHNTDDATVSYRYSQYFVDMVNRSGQEAILYTFTSGGHNAWANGESVRVAGINGQITIKESQYQAYLFFEKLEKHEEHYAWVDPAVEATCTETGLTAGSHCAACGEILQAQEAVAAKGHTPGAEAACTTAQTCTVCNAELAPAKGHTEVVDQASVPSCTEPGLTEGKHCSDCGAVLVKQEVVSALGHAEVLHEGKAATCTEKGWEAYVTCSHCDYTTYKEIAASGHSYTSVVTAPTCTEQGYTTHTCACGDFFVDAYVDALGHDYGDWQETQAPTCTEPGAQQRDCGRCDYSETREVAAIGHNYESVVKVPTCMEPGYTAHTCTVCGASYTSDHVQAAGHTEVVDAAIAPTCTGTGLTEGKHCSVCNEVLVKQETVAAKGHSYESVVKAPTCMEPGYTTHTCTVCGGSYVDAYTDMKGHSFGDWFIYRPSTGKNNGEARRECACGHYESQVLPLLGDVNGDRKVNTTDAKLIMQYELGLIGENALDLTVADVNGDGKYNTTDAKLIMQLELHLIEEYP